MADACGGVTMRQVAWVRDWGACLHYILGVYCRSGGLFAQVLRERYASGLEHRSDLSGDVGAGRDPLAVLFNGRLLQAVQIAQQVRPFQRQTLLCAEIGELFLVHPEDRLAERPAGDPATTQAVRLPVQEIHLRLASRAWRAFTQPTPEAWFDLLTENVSALPYLRRTVLEMLQELPDMRTGLGATEAAMLALIALGDAAPFDVFPGHLKKNTRRVFDYWEVGQMLDWLAQAPKPAILGLDDGPFTLAMHDAPDRYARYSRSRLSLTGLGRRLVAAGDDISLHRPICRWWGGTHLTNDALWRWDADTEQLTAPHGVDRRG
jgi:hypothetical protein